MDTLVRDVSTAVPLMAKLALQHMNLPKNALRRFPVPMVSRSMQLDSELIESCFFNICKEQLLGAFIVDGGESGLTEYSNIDTTVTTGNFGLSSLLSLISSISSRIRALFVEKLPLWRAHYQDDILLALRLVLFKMTFWDHNAFMGDRMHNLVYQRSNGGWGSVTIALNPDRIAGKDGLGSTALLVNTASKPGRYQKLLFGIILYILPYLLEKLRQYALTVRITNVSQTTEQNGIARKLKYAETAEKIINVLNLANLIIFFTQGKYRSLADRICRLRLAHGHMKMTRFINLELMNQTILANGWFEFVSFLSSLMRLHSVVRTAMEASRSAIGISASYIGLDSIFGTSNESNSYQREDIPRPSFERSGSDRCTICRGCPVSVPRVSRCGHLFCYFCIASLVRTERTEPFCSDDDNIKSTQSHNAYKCPACHAPITEFAPLPRENLNI
eukprot:Tbor_TRINITY_DN3173_c0_g1::TRINITY_DN3173_c0_g1_i1::g.14765::m.14765/K06664/PEX2, PXMP3; peroxin-2